MKPSLLAVIALAILSHIWPASAQNVVAFAPGGPTVTLSVSGTTARVQVQTAANSPHFRFYNAGTVAVFVVCGDVASTATVAAGMPIAPASVEVLSCNLQQYVAGISAGTAATLYITPGDGL